MPEQLITMDHKTESIHLQNKTKMDTKFFTNDPGSSLIDRFNATLKDVDFFDIIVAYFRVSGFYLMADKLENVKKIRILVGINVDSTINQVLGTSIPETIKSHSQIKKELSKTLVQEISRSEDRYEIEKGITSFVKFINSTCENVEQDLSNGGNGKKLEIKAFPSSNLHAKVYISRFSESDRDYGRVITGSSNFSHNGLKSNLEFNVELKDYNDIKFAEEKFNDLWSEGVDIGKEFTRTVNNQTWLNDDISPYELYLKALYEYFKEDLNIDQSEETILPTNFKNLEYQQQAGINAKRILESYNGVFLSDVVGLGKTYISAILALKLKGRKLFICPPILKDYWEDTLNYFGVNRFKVQSSGQLEHLIEVSEKYDFVFVDEAHRFRNEYTQGFEYLDRLCKGKKVVLISATPFNNNFDDIFALIKLFQPSKSSSIPGISNLEAFFNRISKSLKKYKKGSNEYSECINRGATEIRNGILKHLMIRRTRTEILKYFPEDLENQKIVFPKVAPPRQIIYRFDDQYKEAVEKTIISLQGLGYARYSPRFYLISSEKQEGRELSLRGFMKSLLVKRLESSLYAFTKSIERLIHSYEDFIDMFKKGRILISKKINIYDLIEQDDESKIETLIKANKVEEYEKIDFKESYLQDLFTDLKILKEIKLTWDPIVSLEQRDPKIESLIDKLDSDNDLKNKVIVFTESKETGEYLFRHLNDHYQEEVFFFSSDGGKQGDNCYTNREAKKVISRSLTTNYTGDNGRSIKILITTDILAEGVNLQESNVIINYDLPWNPTRVLQRVGRVNRLDTKHENIYVYNFFPSETTEPHIPLKDVVVSKLQAFHKVLGEDAKYLTSEEVIESHELMGKNLYLSLNSLKTYQEDEEENDSELKYLREIREIRDNDQELFVRIKQLPIKARSSSVNSSKSQSELITFFRKGYLKKFFISSIDKDRELNFTEAAKKLKCSPETPKSIINKEYFYKMLAFNKNSFKQYQLIDEFDQSFQEKNSPNEKLLKRLLTKNFGINSKLTNDQEDYIRKVILALRIGFLGKNLVKRLNQVIEREPNPIKVYSILHREIGDNYLEKLSPTDGKKEFDEEIVLSKYLSHG